MAMSGTNTQHTHFRVVSNELILRAYLYGDKCLASAEKENRFLRDDNFIFFVSILRLKSLGSFE